VTKTVLLTWELGGELGHLSNLHSIATSLVTHGFTVFVAVQDISRAHQFFHSNDGIQLVQAPIWLPKIHMQRPIACLADVLLLKGYLKAAPLRQLVQTWKTLFQLTKPDLLICDYSPTAMLASVDSDIPRLTIGTGYSDPVPGHPIKDWRVNQSNDGLVAAQEQVLLKSIEAALGPSAAFQFYGDIFACEGRFICTLPQLDLYGEHRDHNEQHSSKYCINIAQPSRNETVQWQHKKRSNILVYLKPHYSHLAPLLRTLGRCNANVFVACPGGNPATLRPFVTNNLTITTQFAGLFDAFSTADLFVGHGNMGSTAQSLAHGVPVVALPRQQENQLNTQMLIALGVGLTSEKPESEACLEATLHQALTNTAIRKNAYNIAQQSAHLIQTPLHEQVLARCLALLR